MANWDLSNTTVSASTPATAGSYTTETDHLVGTSLTNIDPITSSTYFTTSLARGNNPYIPNDWSFAFSNIGSVGGDEYAPPSDRRSRGQLYPR